MNNIATVWDTVKSNIDKTVLTPYIISLPVLSAVRPSTILCFVSTFTTDEIPIISRPTHWVMVDMANNRLTLYDCKVTDFCNMLSFVASFKGNLCVGNGVEALNSCLQFLTEIFSQTIDSGNDIYSSSQALPISVIDNYNNKVLEMSTSIYHTLYQSLIRI